MDGEYAGWAGGERKGPLYSDGGTASPLDAQCGRGAGDM